MVSSRTDLPQDEQPLAEEELEEVVEVYDEASEDEYDEYEELPSDRVCDLVELIVCNLVDDVNAVSLDVTENPGSALIEIGCATDDAGKIIGRRGRTIKAIRTLARALGQRVGTMVEVEVLG